VRAIIRWFVVVVVVAHGLAHLPGAAKRLGWADVSQLTRHVSAAAAEAWLASAVLVVAAGMLLAVSVRWWWAVGAVAVTASQTVIFAAWSDARVGTFAGASDLTVG
jgi:hypothetical protein